MRSIRGRLLAGLLGSMLVVLLAGAALIYAAVQDEVTELFDYQLEQTAYEFAAQPLPAPRTLAHKSGDDPEAEFVIQVWDETGSPLYRSSTGPEVPRGSRPGFSKHAVDGERWRLFDADVGGRHIQVAQPLRVRNSVAGDIATHALLLFAPMFPFAALLIWLTVSRGLRPLQRVAGAVQKRSHRDLTPIDPAPLPAEIAPLAVSLNDLMARLGRVIKAQQTFVADAAHELLTPITALQLQAQLLSRASDEAGRQQALSDLRAGLARTIRMAQQLLTLARQDADLQGLQMATVDLAELARRVVAMQQPLAENKGIALELRAGTACPVIGEAGALATLLANLLENAIKYTPSGGQVAVAVDKAGGGAAVLIEDSGPGIPAQERERVFDRFYRSAGNDAMGSGLGLAIARDIAARHGARIELHTSTRLGGLGVRVSFHAIRDLGGAAH
jgi:two-component system OmpR family sensor kinase